MKVCRYLHIKSFYEINWHVLFIVNVFKSIDDFLNSTEAKILLVTEYEVVLKRLVGDLSEYQEALMWREEDLSQSSFDESHGPCAQKLKQLEWTLKQVEARVDSLEDKLDRLIKLVERSQDPTSGLAPGTFEVLDAEEKWILRKDEVTKSGTDSSNYDLANLLDSVFGRSFFLKYSTYDKIPQKAHDAFVKVQSKLLKRMFTL